MKRSDLLRHLHEHGCQFLREGSNHTVYWNPSNHRTSTVPRHTEVNFKISLKICADLGVPKPLKK